MAEHLSKSFLDNFVDYIFALDDPANAGKMIIVKDSNEPKENTIRDDGEIVGPWFASPNDEIVVRRFKLHLADYKFEKVQIERKAKKNFADTISDLKYFYDQLYKAKDAVRILGKDKYCIICESSREEMIKCWMHHREENLIRRLEQMESVCRVIYAKDRYDAERIALMMFKAQRTDIDID